MRLIFATMFLAFAGLSLQACGNSSPTESSIERDHDEHDGHAHDDQGDEDEHSGHDDHDEHDHDEDDQDEHGDANRQDEHAGHDHGDDEHSDHVELSPEATREAGIVVSVAAMNAANESLSLPAELRFDADRVAAVSPLVSGRIEKLIGREGDAISRGDTLAVLASRELADLKAEYLSAATAETLARQALDREETLFAEKITSEADLQTARAALAAARAQREGVENKLHAVGVSDAELSSLSQTTDGSLATTRIRAPISGVIAQRTAMLGATVSADDPGAPALFTIVDDSVLWADIAVYKQDIGVVQPGIPVRLVSNTGNTLASGEVALVLPSFDEASRTVTARMIVDNGGRGLRPGQFVTAQIDTGSGALAVMVPTGAVVQVEGRTVVFVPTDDGFEPRSVTAGQRIGDQTVIHSGLAVGEQYVTEGAFTLKAQLEKDAFGDGHVH